MSGAAPPGMRCEWGAWGRGMGAQICADVKSQAGAKN